MEITDNLFAAYVEGNVTDDERLTVRNYLTEHPDELECVALMMDTDDDLKTEDFDSEDFDANTATIQHRGSFSDICYSAAAFVPDMAPLTNILDISETSFGEKNKTTFSQRLDSLLDDISK